VARPSHLRVRLLSQLFLVALAAARTVQLLLLPFNPQFSPFTVNRLTNPYRHAILSRVCQAPAPTRSPKPPSRYHIESRSGGLQSSYPKNSNGPLYPFSFQYFLRPSFPSWLDGKPLILFPFIPLQTLSLSTGGYTPLPYPDSTAAGRTNLHLFPFPSTTYGLFCAMERRNPCTFIDFRTLSIAMGVYTPTRHSPLATAWD
jgi:hypothetical protein